MSVKTTLLRAGLEALYFSGAHRLMRPFVAGVGAILMLHHVRPARRDRFQPNRSLEVTPEYLERVIRHLRDSDVDLVSLDELHRRLTERDVTRRFACFTLDDGYRDNKEWAFPIFKAAQVPFAIYVATSFPDRLGKLWWIALEMVIAHLAYPYGDRATVGPREFRIAAERGYKTAVTTRPGVLFADHAQYLTALPRISLNGAFQSARFIPVLVSGAATALWNGFRRVDAA